jgi:hypothetical protein
MKVRETVSIDAREALHFFNANLQEFSQQVNYICNLQTNGKLYPKEAYKKIKTLWKQLKSTKKQLDVGEHPFQNEA